MCERVRGKERERERGRERERVCVCGVFNEEEPDRDGRNSDKQLQRKAAYIDLEKERKIFFIDQYRKLRNIYIYIESERKEMEKIVR